MRAMFDAAVLSSSWLTGFTVCLSLIASIGAQNLYVLRQAVQGEHVRACVAWCVASDALLVALGVAGMARLLAGAPTLALWLRLGGALFLLGYGLLAWQRALFAADAGVRAGGARVARGWLGVMIQEVTPELAQSFGLDKPRGALVGQVLADGPAQKAGVKAGDIIVAFNNQPVRTSSDLPLMVGRTRPGTNPPLTVIRDGKEQILTVQIAELPEETKLQQAIAEPPTHNRLGLMVAELPAGKRKSGEQGVLVKDVDEGPAASAGIRPGDIITRINNVEVTDTDQFAELVKALPTARPIPVLIKRDNGALFLALTIPDKE